MRPVRTFLATRRDASVPEVASLTDSVGRALTARLPADCVLSLISARDAYTADFGRLGSWEAWQTDVAKGVRYDDRTPNYHLFVVPDFQIGRATASILTQALEAKKPVLHFDPHTARMSYVDRIQEDDSQNWKGGWSVCLRA